MNSSFLTQKIPLKFISNLWVETENYEVRKNLEKGIELCNKESNWTSIFQRSARNVESGNKKINYSLWKSSDITTFRFPTVNFPQHYPLKTNTHRLEGKFHLSIYNSSWNACESNVNFNYIIELNKQKVWWTFTVE